MQFCLKVLIFMINLSSSSWYMWHNNFILILMKNELEGMWL